MNYSEIRLCIKHNERCVACRLRDRRSGGGRCRPSSPPSSSCSLLMNASLRAMIQHDRRHRRRRHHHHHHCHHHIGFDSSTGQDFERILLPTLASAPRLPLIRAQTPLSTLSPTAPAAACSRNPCPFSQASAQRSAFPAKKALCLTARCLNTSRRPTPRPRATSLSTSSRRCAPACWHAVFQWPVAELRASGVAVSQRRS
jgi:hypothetical protein